MKIYIATLHISPVHCIRLANMSDNMKEYDPQKFSLQRHDYVWIKIDIHSTLSQEFSIQSLLGAEGTFPLDSPEAQEKAWSLVDDFLEEIDFPIEATFEERDKGRESPCPVFRPGHHLVLIHQVYKENGVDIVVFPVHKTGDLHSRENESIFYQRLRQTLVPIIPLGSADNLPDHAVRLRTTAGLGVQEPISQNGYNTCMFVVSSLIGDASDVVRLDSTSSSVFNEVADVAPVIMEYSKSLNLNGGAQTKSKMSCGCDEGAHPPPLSEKNYKSFSALSDVVVEVAYKGSSDQVSRWVDGLSLACRNGENSSGR